MNLNSLGKDHSILYVDDEEKALKYFHKYFSKDYNILTAINTTEARKILDSKATEIGILLTDQRMPKEKGVELLKYSRENYPHIVRLLTTAYSDLNDAIEAVNRGEIMRYIPKPWDINFLELELRQAMRFFLLNKERDLLRKEKISVIQRFAGVNRAKNFIVLSTGMTHIKYPLHAIKAFLLQLPDIPLSHEADFKRYDMWDLIKDEIEEIFMLAADVFSETMQNDNFKFEQVDIIDKCRKISDKLPVTVIFDNAADSKLLEANPDLIERLLQIILEQICWQPDTDIDEIKISILNDENELQININSCIHLDNMSILNTPAYILSAYYICYHHGGKLQIDYDITGTNLILRLPYKQNNIEIQKLTPFWQEEIFRRYEILPGK